MGDLRVGLLGSGFIGAFYAEGLRFVPNARLVVNYGAGPERREAFRQHFDTDRTWDSIEGLCADPAVDLVVVALPNHLHLPAVQAAAANGKAVVCTKPLGRNASEAALMLGLVEAAGVVHGYLENVVFSPDMIKIHDLIESGGIGRIVSVRAREGHSGPHAAHFWDASTAGGGALLDMGPHTIETARYLFGKNERVVDVFAWGANLVHGRRTAGEDNAIAIIRFEDGRTALSEVSWAARGGLEARTEVTGTTGRVVHDIGNTTIRAFVDKPAGYLAEKVDAEIGWVFPVADETRSHGYDQQMREMVEAVRAGRQPREDFRDGYIVNTILDAAYRSMSSGRWEPVERDEALLTPGLPIPAGAGSRR